MSSIHASLAAEKVTEIAGFPITNSMILSWVASALLIFVALIAARKPKLIPRGIQNVLEIAIEFLWNTVNSVLDDKKATKKYFPLIATLFLFILTNNWLGTLPGIGTIGLNEIKDGEAAFVPFFRPGNADLNHTLALAVISVISVQFFGITALGFFKYASKFINFKSPVDFFIGILEIIGEVAKILSFSFRLFGNIFAGEVLLTVIASIAPYAAPIPFSLLELFVGLIQALVFTMLTIVFIKIAISGHEEHEEHTGAYAH
ncbi:MAG: F0F1 ATP synthase subunit A [Patescibacteria group bacterium]|jgi:F-type H+-transporting ATPase subunit a